MSARHQPVSWTQAKKAYDLVLVAGVLLYLLAFLQIGPLLQDPARPLDAQSLAIKAYGSCAFILLTLALTVAVINAMNFVDGLDGLAAGLGLITALAICIFSVGLLRDHGGDVLFYPPAVISVVLAGACLGFLPHNFHPAKIFMGDSGSMLVGLMLAAATTTAQAPVPQASVRPTPRSHTRTSKPPAARG
jgi:UDP-N-acetylmuramyl pentapeptide phosphotransferase/UDP-N-acetylglucosamine-1-phosphate transferase